jgi:Tol biopolymer transport system component
MPLRALVLLRARSGFAAGAVLAVAVVLSLPTSASADPYAAETERVSTTSSGIQGNSISLNPAVSADGRYITYHSSANNLVPGDTNGAVDVFLTDTTTDATSRVSEASDGTQGNNASNFPAISADGRYITYHSSASNLVTGDTNDVPDIFLTDTTTGTTTRVSTAPGGTQSDDSSFVPSISADGRYITYHSTAGNLVTGDTNGSVDIFLTDTSTGATTRVSTATDGTQGDGSSYYAAISADGGHITYHSLASNLVTGDTNGVSDVFLTDTATGTTTRVSTATDGIQGDDHSYEAAISADGRYIAYYSYATTLVTGDTNGVPDVFLTDTTTGTTTRVSTATDGTQSDNSSFVPSISADGRYITYDSYASNLVTGDINIAFDIFLTDTTTGATTRVSTATDGTQGNDDSLSPAISADGRYVTYHSSASNLITGDTNGLRDVFVTRIGAAPIVTSQPADVTVTAGDSAHFTAAFTDAPTIQWQTAADPGGPWTDIPGATATTLDLPTSDVGTSYVRAIATNPGGSVTSAPATLSATATDPGGIITTASATLPATGNDPTGPLTIAALLIAAGILTTRARRLARRAR